MQIEIARAGTTADYITHEIFQALERLYIMETALIFAQTVFYLTVSLAIIVIGVFFVIAIYHLVRIVRELKQISQNLNHAVGEIGERIRDTIDGLSNLPILSYFLKKRRTSHEKKGRENSSKK